MNEPKQDYQALLDEIESELDITLSEVQAQEFTCFAALEFHLHVPSEEAMPHFNRIINVLEYSNIQEYLGEKLYAMHFEQSPTSPSIELLSSE